LGKGGGGGGGGRDLQILSELSLFTKKKGKEGGLQKNCQGGEEQNFNHVKDLKWWGKKKGGEAPWFWGGRGGKKG